MSFTAPHRTVLTAAIAPIATAGNSQTTPIGIAPYAGEITAAQVVPADDITGAATNNRRVRVINRGQDGNGTTVVATVQFTNGTDADGFAPCGLALATSPEDRLVQEGDVLAWESAAVGTGITDPGGLAHVVVARA